jgi:hypothetical protein
MATRGFDEALVPITTAVTAQTSATRLFSSSTLAVRFHIYTGPANTSRVFYGDSSVSATRSLGLAGGSFHLHEQNLTGRGQVGLYDLAEIFAMATQASQTFTIIRWVPEKWK